MRSPIPLFFLLVLAATLGCANVDDVTLGGPAVHDQLNSRGYIATSLDTVMPVDTTGHALDSMGQY
ncbi:MAG: hypothetical protein ACOH13_10620 [Flavobacteriales bacterium]